MGKFLIPDGPMLQPAPPAPPPDPRVARAEKIANDTRVESELNRFIASRQDAMFNNPDAFYRTEGENAIHAAPVATKNLEQLRNDLLDGLANDYQRKRLSAALEAQMQLTRQQMARHVAEQSLAWQRSVAQDRIALLTKEAAYHHNDIDLVDSMGHAAANAARAHMRVGDVAPGGPAEDAAAATARSSVLGAAIQARLDRGNAAGANALLVQMRDQLDPAHAAPLQGQIETVQRLDAAKDYARRLVPVWSDASHEEVDAQHASATRQNRTDNAGDPEYQADVQHVLDVQHGLQKQSLDRQLQRNGEAPGTDQTGHFVLVPFPGSPAIEPVSDQPPDQQSPDQNRSLSPEQQPDPAPNGPVGTELPVPPAREQNPENSAENPEKTLGPAVIEKLRAALIASPSIGVPKVPTTGPLPEAVAQRLATTLAAAAPGAVGTAALAAGAAASVLLTPTNSQGGIIELGDGVRAQWVPGQRSATIERRTSKGLFGSDVGAHWEELPVRATYEAGPDGRPTLFVDPQALKAALATPYLQALPASKPSILEIRIGTSADGGATTSFREATHEDIERLCPGYPMIQGVGTRASMEYSGLPNGLVRGNAVHQLAKIENLKIARSEQILREMGIRELLPEVALKSGERFSYRTKGSSVLDVAEIYERRGEREVCVYDFKTGKATFPDATAIRYAHEAGLYVERQFGAKAIHITVVPVYLH